MILKKPYAFLIKNFRIIHLLLTSFNFYILYKNIMIFNFFNNYAKNNYFIYGNSLSSYVGFVLILTSFLSIFLLFIIYYLLKAKNKPNKFYLYCSIFNLFLLIYFFVMSSLFNDLNYVTFSFEKIRLIRDFGIITLVPQIIFLIILLGRTLGFNIRKFEFNKDINLLEINESDSEEIEVVLGEGNYKYKRLYKKILRYLKYIFIENKFLISIVISIGVLVLVLYLLLSLKKENVYYYENQEIYNYSYYTTIKDSFVDNVNNDNYLLVKIEVRNNSEKQVILNTDNYRVISDGKLIHIDNYSSNTFMDIAKVYKQETLNSGEIRELLLVFNVNKIESEYVLKIKNLNNSYNDVIIKPKNLYSLKDYGVFTKEIIFNNSTLFNSKYSLNSYELKDLFIEEYNYCVNDDCNIIKYTVKSDDLNKPYLLKLNSEFVLDNNINEIDKNEFLCEFGKINFRYEGNYKTININIAESFSDEYTYIEVPNELLYADKINLIINLRNYKYTLVLK